jgi:ribosomal protein L37AE/L43A
LCRVVHDKGCEQDEKKVGSMDKSNREPGTLTCPFCSEAELRGFGRNSLRCDECGGVLGGALLETLKRIVALPDAAGGHACECGHPEMRRLPDGVYRCPACGSEVTPVSPGVLEVARPYRGVLVRLARRPLRRP